MSKQLDSLDFMPIWGTIGHLKGYLFVLKRRLIDNDPPLDEFDINYLEKLVVEIENQLVKAFGYEK